MRGYFVFVGYVLLILQGLNGGLGALELVAGSVVLLFTLRQIGRVILVGSGEVFGLAIAVAGGLLMSARSFAGRWDLPLVPQGYRLELESYAEAALLAHLSVGTSILVYMLVRGKRQQVPASERLVPDFPWHTGVVVASGLVAARFGALSLGIGVKGADVVVGFGAVLFVVFGVLNVLATAGLLMSAIHEGSPRKTKIAMGLIGADTLVALLGGARGAIFDAVLIVVLVLALLNRQLLTRKSLVGWSLGGVFVLVGTNFALGRRLAVQGGGDEFGVIEFLALRLPGTHRFAPVVDSGVTVGWGKALGDPTVVKDLVYRLNEASDTGIGTQWIGLGYLADGVAGLLLVSLVIGLLAGFGDRMIASTTSLVNLSFWLVLAVTFLSSYGGARPRAESRSLIVLAVAYLGVRLWLSMQRNDKTTQPVRQVDTTTSGS